MKSISGSTTYFSLASIVAIGGLFWVSQARTRAATTPAEVTTEVSAGEGHESGCSGCFCCFPRTPDGNVNLNGFEPVGSTLDTTVYTTPHDMWFMVTDLEVVVLDEQGVTTDTLRIGLYENDDMGMSTLKRWADCSVYHSARGIAIRPNCDVVLANLPGMPTGMRMPAKRVYWQLNGYLWDGGSEH